MKTILITGASGLIGKALIKELLSKGYEIHTLTRSRFKTDKRVSQFLWQPDEGKLDSAALEGVDTIINLAGAGVADQRWTENRKRELWDSRINALRTLYKNLSWSNHKVSQLISASAVGYYGDRGPEQLSEKSKAGSGFLSELCVAWEKELDTFSKLGIQTKAARIGIVLSPNGGALPEMLKTVQLGIGGYFAKKDLYYPWIHMDDIVGAFVFLIENETKNKVFNFTAPSPVTHRSLMQEALKASDRNAVLAPAPPFALKLALGEMADMLLNSQYALPNNLISEGYKFKYQKVAEALKACF